MKNSAAVSTAVASFELNYLTPAYFAALKRIRHPSVEMIDGLQAYLDMCAEQYDMASDLIKAWKASMPTVSEPAVTLEPVMSTAEAKPKKVGRKPKMSIVVSDDSADTELARFVHTRRNARKGVVKYKRTQTVYKRGELKAMAADYPMENNVFDAPNESMRTGSWLVATVCNGVECSASQKMKQLYIRDPRTVMPQYVDAINAGINACVDPVRKICAHLYNRYYNTDIVISHISAAFFNKPKKSRKK